MQFDNKRNSQTINLLVDTLKRRTNMPSTLSVFTSKREKSCMSRKKFGLSVVYRSNNNANAYGGVSYANANNGFTNANTRIGVRLAIIIAQELSSGVKKNIYPYVSTLGDEFIVSAYRELNHGNSKRSLESQKMYVLQGVK